MGGVFITGTDTEVGKTYCSVQLLRALNDAGISTAAMKPVASGAIKQHGQWRNDDALQLLAAASVSVAYANINPYVFEPAIAPHIAAAQAGVNIDLSVIKREYLQLKQQAEVVVVEGVGGWLVPLNDKETVADLARMLDLPVILVVGMRLGCINHALLSAESIQHSGLELTGWIANDIESVFPYRDENIATLKQKIAAPLLGHIPHQHKPHQHTLENNSILDISWV